MHNYLQSYIDNCNDEHLHHPVSAWSGAQAHGLDADLAADLLGGLPEELPQALLGDLPPGLPEKLRQDLRRELVAGALREADAAADVDDNDDSDDTGYPDYTDYTDYTGGADGTDGTGGAGDLAALAAPGKSGSGSAAPASALWDDSAYACEADEAWEYMQGCTASGANYHAEPLPPAVDPHLAVPVRGLNLMQSMAAVGRAVRAKRAELEAACRDFPEYLGLDYRWRFTGYRYGLLCYRVEIVPPEYYLDDEQNGQSGRAHPRAHAPVPAPALACNPPHASLHAPASLPGHDPVRLPDYASAPAPNGCPDCHPGHCASPAPGCASAPRTPDPVTGFIPAWEAHAPASAPAHASPQVPAGAPAQLPAPGPKGYPGHAPGHYCFACGRRFLQ